MDWFLLVVAIIMSLVIVASSVYLVILYSSEDDKNMAWMPKVIVVLGFSLACVVVLLLPFDVANRRDPTSMARFGGGLDTELMWRIMLWTVAVMVVVVIPFATFYYEAYDPDQYNFFQQVTPAILYTFGAFFIFTLLCVVLWITVGEAAIPYYSYTGLGRCVDVRNPLEYYSSRSVEKLNLRVSFFVYVVALLSFVGWILFFIYGGVGLTALPVDIMTEFMMRPKPISAQTYHRETEVIAAKCAGMLELGKKLLEKQRRKNNNKVRQEVNHFRNETLELEKNLDRLDVAYKDQGGSPFVVFGTLMVGILSFGLSILWVIHIFLYNTLDANPFLNVMLIDLDNAFALLGTMAYAMFAYYLLWCTVKGCIKVGVRIVFFQIHPMKVHDTLMNSMLFNTGLILLCSVTVTSFCATSFRDYSSYTAIDTLLNVYVRRLKGIGYVISLMQFFFVAIAILSIFWIMLCPKKKQKKKDDDDDD